MNDQVYHKVYLREGKLDRRRIPFYRIVEQTGHITYIIWDQVAEKVKQIHAHDIKLAEIDEWEGAKEKKVKKRIEEGNLDWTLRIRDW